LNRQIRAGLIRRPNQYSPEQVNHLIEGDGNAPPLVAKLFKINPVMTVLSIMCGLCVWASRGFLAVPVLAMTKIICDRIDVFDEFGHFISGRS
jgi:hypothetical protein